jgi:hypothetical protein
MEIIFEIAVTSQNNGAMLMQERIWRYVDIVS